MATVSYLQGTPIQPWVAGSCHPGQNGSPLLARVLTLRAGLGRGVSLTYLSPLRPQTSTLGVASCTQHKSCSLLQNCNAIVPAARGDQGQLSISPSSSVSQSRGTWEWLGEGRVHRPQDVLQSLSFHSCINYCFLGVFWVCVLNSGNPDAMTSACICRKLQNRNYPVSLYKC